MKSTKIILTKLANIKNSFLLLSYLVVSVFASKAFAVDDNFIFSAGDVPAPRNFSDLTCRVIKLALDFVPYLVVIAIGAFLQGLIKYVGHGDNEEKKSEGIKMMIYGSLGFFFMVGVWGILSLFTQSFGIDLAIPQFKSGSNFSETCR